MSCLASAMELVAKRDWLREELREKLAKKYGKEEIEEALVWLDEHKVLKDHWVVVRSIEFNTGRKAVSRAAWMEKLRKRGADEGLLIEAVEALQPDLEIAKQILQGKSWKTVGQAARHLSAKGFESETIESALEASFDEEFRSQ